MTGVNSFWSSYVGKKVNCIEVPGNRGEGQTKEDLEKLCVIKDMRAKGVKIVEAQNRDPWRRLTNVDPALAGKGEENYDVQVYQYNNTSQVDSPKCHSADIEFNVGNSLPN